MLNLNIESLQDSYYAKSKSSNFGISAGGGSSGASAGFNFGKTDSTTDSQWVNEQTSIIADNNVNIKTNNNTNLIGSVVASNSDNLTLNTGSLTYSDLNDFYREETKGYNFGTSVGADKTDQNKTNLHPQGSTTIGLTHTGQEKEQITRATIGLGNITINSKPLTPTPLPQGARDILAGLNRNVDNSQEITKDIITGALNGSMTIDNRVFTSDGRKEIVKQMVNLPGNIVKATAGAINTAVNPLITAYEVATNKDVGINDVVDQWKSNAKAGANMIKSDRNVINNLSTGKADVNDIQKATGNDKVKVYYDENDKVQGFHDDDTNDIYLNAANNTATNTDTFVRTYGHETAHDYTQNESVANNAGSYAKGIFNTLNTLSFDSVNTSENATSKDWLGNQFSNVNSANALANNTIKVGGVVNRSNKVVQGVRDLQSFFVGNHSYVIITPNNPEDFTPEKMLERGFNPDEFKFIDLGDGKKSIVISGFDVNGNLEAKINNSTDVKAIRDYNANGGQSTSFASGNLSWDYDVETREIKPKDGMTDTEFGYTIMQNTKNYQQNTNVTPLNYGLVPSCTGGYNCNSFSNSLLKYSGSSNQESTDFKGNDAGRNNLINVNYFENNSR